MIARVRYRAPYDWAAMLGHIRARAISGVEIVEGDVYRRAFAIEGKTGTIAIVHEPADERFSITIESRAEIPRAGILARVKHMLDLDADDHALTALAKDPLLGPMIARRPGLRTPGAWEPFELAMRAVLGQQVTVEAARQLGGKLAEICGQKVTLRKKAPALLHAFPTARQVADADLSRLGMPESRRRTLRAIAEAAVADPALFEKGKTLDETIARLRSIKGIGDWTAHYIALRAVREPDAFPASDIGLLRGASGEGARLTPAQLLLLAEKWRPWRAYAAQHLWSSDANSPRKKPKT